MLLETHAVIKASSDADDKMEAQMSPDICTVQLKYLLCCYSLQYSLPPQSDAHSTNDQEVVGLSHIRSGNILS